MMHGILIPNDNYGWNKLVKFQFYKNRNPLINYEIHIIDAIFDFYRNIIKKQQSIS